MEGRNNLPGNCLVGQLVESGFEMERLNGKRLRQAYVEVEKLLPEAWWHASTDSNVFLRSTDVPRTKQSAMALIAGLVGKPAADAIPNFRLMTMDYAQENMFVNKRVCPAVESKQKEFYESLSKETTHELLTLCDSLNHRKKTVKECAIWLSHLIDCLMSRICTTVPFHPRNTTVPAKFFSNESALLRRVWEVVDQMQWQYFQAMTSAGAFGSLTSEILKAADIAAGRLLSHSTQKLLLYSGHDTGPMEPLYAALQLRTEPPFWPPFASMLSMEIWNSTSGPLVRLVLNSKVVVDATPWDKYRERLQTLSQTVAKCSANNPRSSSKLWTATVESHPAFSSSLFGFGWTCVSCLALAAVAFLIRRGRKLQMQGCEDAGTLIALNNASWAES